jgi:hypothetical protein
MHARGSLLWIDYSELGRIVLPHSPLVFERGYRPVPLRLSHRVTRSRASRS